MKHTVIILIILMASQLSIGQGIHFKEMPLKQALELARQENKILFVDCYTSWCAPCKLLDKSVFAQAKVGDVFNSQFVSIKLNMEQEELRPLAQQYNVRAFPSLLFLDADGQLLHKVVGYMQAEDLLHNAQIALHQPDMQLATLNKRYDAGERDVTFLTNYINTLQRASERARIRQVGQAFMEHTPEEKYATAAVFKLIDDANLLSCKSAAYNFFVTHKTAFTTAVGIGDEGYRRVMSKCIKTYLNNQSRKVDILDLRKQVEECKTDFKLPDQLMFEADLYGDWYIQHQQYNDWFNQMEASANNMIGVNKAAAYSFLIKTTYRIAQDPLFKTIDGAYNKGITLLLKAQEIAGDKMTHYYGLANLYYITGDKANALKSINSYDKAIKEHGGQVTAHFLKLKSEIEAM